MASNTATRTFAVLICIALAVIAGIVAIGTQEWTVFETDTLLLDVRSTSGIFGNSIDVLDGELDFETNLDDCEGDLCNALRAVAATSILAILLGGIAAIVTIVGACFTKPVGGVTIRLLLGIAFLCNVIACIVYAVVVYNQNLRIDGIAGEVVESSLGYSWGLLIPAAFFDMVASYFTG